MPARPAEGNYSAALPAAPTSPAPAKKMDFRRSGQLDERRRRVLMDEIATPAAADDAEAAPAATSAKGPVRAYCPAVLQERQLRVTDFIAVRPLHVAVVLLLGLTGIAAVEAIHIHAATIAPPTAVQLAAFDAAARGSLAGWYASLMLLGATGLALAVFAIRVHRVDDYRGRYRVWLWAAAALAWLSLDAATGIHDALGLAATLAAGQSANAGSVALAWLAIYTLLLGALGIRLAIEVWPSLPSFGTLLFAGLLYLLCALMHLGVQFAATPLAQSVAASSLALLAHLTLAASIGLYARHVYLDATGRLKVHIDPDKKRGMKAKSRARLKVVKEDKADGSQPAGKPVLAPAARSAEPARFGAASSGSKPAAISKSSLSAPPDDEDDDEDASDYGGEKLSRAERRRLKKLARQGGQRRAA